MIKIKEAVVVEGKYDKIKLSRLFDTDIITTGGFEIFKNKENAALIKRIAEKRGVIILTDSDSSGLMIRNYLKNIIGTENIKQAFVPAVRGRERRKRTGGKAGILGVEGLEDRVIIDCVMKLASPCDNSDKEKIERIDLYKMGLYGCKDSSALRKRALSRLSLPEGLSVSMLLDVINTLYSKNELCEILKERD